MRRRKGFIAYRDPSTGLRLHFRIDKDGKGVLVVNASRVLYANRTAAFYIRLMLEGASPEEAARKAVKEFRGVTFEQAKRDYEDVVYRVNSFISGEACPLTYLGFERLDPLSVAADAPFRADLALTYDCNNLCVHCYSSSPRRRSELSTKEWKRVIDKLFEVGVPNLLFTGGEPTLREDLPELIAHAEKVGAVTGLVTNGRRLADKSYVRKLTEAGLDYVQITLESHLPEIHERITRVPGSWRETVEGIRNSLEAGLYVDVNMTLSKLNVKHVAGYVDFLAQLGVRNVSANRLIYSGKGLEVREWFEPSFDETARALEILKDKALEHGMKFTWYGVTRYCELNPLELEVGLKFCSACSVTIAIEPDGTVLPCQSYFHPLGNILRDKWEKIWNHELCREIRERRYAAPSCGECGHFAACGGGCPLEAKVRPYPKPPETA